MRYLVSEAEVEWSAVRSSGPGGQNVNKVSTAVLLRFDIRASTLPDRLKLRLLALSDRRISAEGVFVIKAQSTRSLESNKVDALGRLQEIIDLASIVPKARIATRPSRGARQRRLDQKAHRARIKSTRSRASED